MNLDSIFPGNVSMVALGVKFSVNTALPEAVMSWGDVSVCFGQIIDVTRFGNSRQVRSYVLVQFVVKSFHKFRFIKFTLYDLVVYVLHNVRRWIFCRYV